MDRVLETLAAWWRARTGREQRLLQAAIVLTFAVLAPATVYLTAAEFRREAAAELASARHVEAQVAQLSRAKQAEAAAPEPRDPTLHGRVLAAAEAAGLQASGIETSAGRNVRVRFEAADSLAVYRWVAMLGAGGAYVTRTAIVRVADGEQVIAEFDVAESP
jgi:type II secretory pathway component PulM